MTYHCHGCHTPTNPDTDPSPGEPLWCAACTLRREREEALMREWYEDDVPGDAA